GGGGFGGGGGFNSPPNSGNGFGFGGFRGGPGFDIDRAMRIRTIHGIVASVAMVILFPGGSIMMRIIPGRFAIWIHALAQLAAYAVYIAGAALGIILVREVNIPFQGGTLLTNNVVRYHPIIGLVVLAALFFQPILGLIHHYRYKRLQRRQVWSHLHLWNGRLTISLGIINGGLGLYLAGAANNLKIAYAVVAGFMWLLWMFFAVFGEIRRARAGRKSTR
ncbi:hypothetical protein GQ53DRAFT_606058, partial [Thozetella sp. PMI_491]